MADSTTMMMVLHQCHVVEVSVVVLVVITSSHVEGRWARCGQDTLLLLSDKRVSAQVLDGYASFMNPTCTCT